jgi:pimeloyl-ACP methyl ester carboxylesterase
VRRRASLLTVGVVVVATALIGSLGSVHALARGGSVARAGVQVGSLTLHPCHVVPHALCGHLRRPWDPGHPAKGQLRVGFAFVRSTDRSAPATGTLVPHEGGPGYSTTDSGADYAAMYGPLLRHHNLLLVDQRGTGHSAAIDCPALQDLHGPYDVAAAKCARHLGGHANLYGSKLAADDQAAVIRALRLGQVDLYGDSYGTFFTQVFAGRHPRLVHSIVLDSAYPPAGETAWYPTQTPAMRQSFALACRRSPACANAPGTPMGLLRRVLHHVRRSPYRGIGYDADGGRHHVVVTGARLVGLAFGATYGPAYYREFTAALRSALRGNRRPLLRLVAETNYGSSDAGPVKPYSEGLDAAVTCQDYPQLFDMSDPPAKRLHEYHASVRREQRRHPHVYAPFTVNEYLQSDWEEADWCLKWPSPPARHRAQPPAPPSGHYPDAPTLVLSGELDSITTPAEGALVAAEFANSRQVIVANSFHVTAEDDTDGCGASLVRSFDAHPARGLSRADLQCTKQVPPLRAIGRYQRDFRGVDAARPASGNQVRVAGRRAVAAAGLTVADLVDRWFNNYSSRVVELYGGTATYTGNRNVTFRLHDVRLNRDLAVSGQFRWQRYRSRLTCRLHLVGTGVVGSVAGHWNTRRADAVAHFHGQVNGHHLHAVTRAP